MALSGVAALGYLAVPSGRINHKLPKFLPMSLRCSDIPTLNVQKPFKCQYKHLPVQMSVSSCAILCSRRYCLNAKTYVIFC